MKKIIVYLLLILAMFNVKVAYNHSTEADNNGKKDLTVEVQFTPDKVVDLLFKHNDGK